MLAYLTGGILFFLSVTLRKKYDLFSAILFSGSMASVYFTTYASYEYYFLINRITAFVIMLVLTFFTVYKSIKYDKKEIAILGLVGAYAIPFFVRGNSDNLMGLFSYIFLINIGVLFIYFKKYWLPLLYLSFFLTWIIFFSCFFLKVGYDHAKLTFGILFYVLFMLSCLGYKLLKQIEIIYFDSIIVVLNTVFLYYSFITLLGENAAGVANITLLFAIVYFLLGIILRQYLHVQQYLSNTLFLIGMTGITVYLGIKCDSLTGTIAWLIESIIVFALGVYFKIKIFRIVTILLFAITLLKLLFIDSLEFTAPEKIIAYIITGLVLLIVSFLYQKFRKIIFYEEKTLE